MFINSLILTIKSLFPNLIFSFTMFFFFQNNLTFLIKLLCFETRMLFALQIINISLESTAFPR